MAFIYHAVPKSIVGEYLLPLSEQSQSLKAKSLGKYEDRTDIFSKQVLPLNCFWPDVIHFSPVEPQKIKAALFSAGFHWAKKWAWFRVDTDKLKFDRFNSTIYLYSEQEKHQFDSQWSDFQGVSNENLAKHQSIPAVTIDHYAEAKSGQPLYTFHRIPQVLFKGPIEIAQLDLIEI